MTISHFCLFQAYRSFPSCVSTALASQTHWIFKDEQPQQYLSSDSHPTHSPGWMTVAQPQLSQLTALTPPKSSRRCRPPLREGLYRHNTFPSPASSEPRTAGPRREQPARRAAFPPPRSPRALPAASHGFTAARYRGRAPAAGRAPAPTDDASPEAGDAKTAAEPPPPAAPPPLPHSASPQRRRAAVPQHPAPGRQRLLSALPPFGGGGPRSHPIPGRKRRARAAEGAGRRGGLRVRVLRCDAAGWRF
ncbi:wiskott-Aldrich syndrome protein homolog 1-like [Centrocercus urophasianus]|uniref:wiskott-Aldrich syndrome protein homolog 1-like n=1 Tax=Centrocercus urophasianus TaxID=9002 RepID=UPI001C64F678|nr:wiskott-Aldrich syndrome protein homolog 1-like [Centrocercus urophasianus]